jgi:hypothetical protein
MNKRYSGFDPNFLDWQTDEPTANPSNNAKIQPMEEQNKIQWELAPGKNSRSPSSAITIQGE